MMPSTRRRAWQARRTGKDTMLEWNTRRGARHLLRSQGLLRAQPGGSQRISSFSLAYGGCSQCSQGQRTLPIEAEMFSDPQIRCHLLAWQDPENEASRFRPWRECEIVLRGKPNSRGSARANLEARPALQNIPGVKRNPASISEPIDIARDRVDCACRWSAELSESNHRVGEHGRREWTVSNRGGNNGNVFWLRTGRQENRGKQEETTRFPNATHGI